MKVTRVAHLGFEVKNMDDMLKFYCDGLGMEQKFTVTYDTLLDTIDHELLPNAPEEEKAVLSYWREQVKGLAGQSWYTYLELADRQFLELFYPTEEKADVPDLSSHYGYQHYSLEVDDIRGMYQRLVEKGYTPDTPLRLGPDFTYQFWVTDPDGNRLELMEYTDKSFQLIWHMKQAAGASEE